LKEINRIDRFLPKGGKKRLAKIVFAGKNRFFGIFLLQLNAAILSTFSALQLKDQT